ncbi:uncharacterized protein LOC18437681 isoform X2 [Amborella trichopoda]|uniref:uncharacterized protein LOC18437681 isoform X2 n=1 Tax=Amborella trichopoda TaxID=13333 RepID=UPI0005D2EBC3|nr:uncharacterized protein LOC18437681 isoform X2 [Amborella trichopoda]|eukprot:XP_011624678.1 uncharacterized protein LOC18437681 isoform X2 [Amborella trichopoda]
MATWEALDVDDSDLQTLFRPKNQVMDSSQIPNFTSQRDPIFSLSSSMPPLVPCSNSNQSRIPLSENSQITRNEELDVFSEKTRVSQSSVRVSSATPGPSFQVASLFENEQCDRNSQSNLNVSVKEIRAPLSSSGVSGPIHGSYRIAASLSQNDQYQSNSQDNFDDPVEEIRVFRGSNRLSRPIPGPAGAIQSAMHDNNFRSDNVSFTGSQCGNGRSLGISVGDDIDFQRNSWLCAMDFIRRENGCTGMDGFDLRSTISSIEMRRNIDRVPQVVGIIKSCKSNGFGDMIVTLKDPTGTIVGCIHHKVLTNDEARWDISVGSVVILNQVVVFSPARATHYLNITLNNVKKVFSKESEPPPKQAAPAYAVRCTTSAVQTVVAETSREMRDKSWTPNQGQVNNRADLHCPTMETEATETSRVRGENLCTAGHKTDQAECHSPNPIKSPQRSHVNAVEAPNQRCTFARLDNTISARTEHGVTGKSVTNFSVANWTDEQIDELLADCEDMLF